MFHQDLLGWLEEKGLWRAAHRAWPDGHTDGASQFARRIPCSRVERQPTTAFGGEQTRGVSNQQARAGFFQNLRGQSGDCGEWRTIERGKQFPVVDRQQSCEASATEAFHGERVVSYRHWRNG
jgi:hypothetical protein